MVIAALALTFGGSAAVGVNIFCNQRLSESRLETVPVVVAKVDIRRGDTIGPDKIQMRDFPKDAVPAAAITREPDALHRVAVHSLVKDEPLLDTKLSPKNGKGGLAALIPAGMRAFTIQTPYLANHLAGLVLPGSKVDVLLTMTGVGTDERSAVGVTMTLLQNIEILALDRPFEAPSENRFDPKTLQSVTLLVTPEQAAKLDLGQNRGTLHLSLRNPDDTRPAIAGPATVSGLQGAREKTWREQFGEVIQSIAKVAADWRAQEHRKPAVEVTAKPDQPSRPAALEIRTLRGTSQGVIYISESRAAN
jgi:pilus assembly protein CpaB